MAIHVVLYEPEIPANTGNIARTCVATATHLHLIHPLGFSTDDKMLRRAGLDYWKHLSVFEYQSIDELFQAYPEGTYYFVENFGAKLYTTCDFSETEEQLFFIFGSETRGIPKKLIKERGYECIFIPATDQVRSLNLSNSVAIIIYEALRQRQFSSIRNTT